MTTSNIVRAPGSDTEPYILPAWGTVSVSLPGREHRIPTPYGERIEWARNCPECAHCGAVYLAGLGEVVSCDAGSLCHVCSPACKAAHAAAFTAPYGDDRFPGASSIAFAQITDAWLAWSDAKRVHHNDGILWNYARPASFLFNAVPDWERLLFGKLFSADPFVLTPLFGPEIPNGWTCDTSDACDVERNSAGDLDDDEYGPACREDRTDITGGRAHGRATLLETGYVESSSPHGLAYLCAACVCRSEDSGEIWFRRPRTPAALCDGCYEPYYRTDLVQTTSGTFLCDTCTDGPGGWDGEYPGSISDFGPADSVQDGDRDEYEPGGCYFERDEGYTVACIECAEELPDGAESFRFCPFCGTRLAAEAAR